jgi:hypothetical protein
MEEIPTTETRQPDTQGVGPEASAPAPTETERSVIAELRDLGERFASALRAASATPEAEALKADLNEGLRDLRGEIDRALQSAKATRQRAPDRSRAADQVRSELAGAMRGLNRALERAAEAMEKAGREMTDADDGPSAPEDTTGTTPTA